jgi:TetR/AcrR family transcriptional repressor of nem operon
MPWPREHKAVTRQRIVEAAASAFRKRGVGGVRVDEIMADAGLTHGGFYAHFSSKDELVSAAWEHANGETLQTLTKALESVPGDEQLQTVIEAYLSPAHAAHPARGCPVAALGSELGRGGGKLHRDLARAVRRRLEWLRTLAPRGSREAARENQVVGAAACMVGGVILARAVGGRDGEALLRACRLFLRGALVGAGSHTSPKAPRTPGVPRRRSSATANRRRIP